jgi:tRNA(adenine34) deaminase
MDYSKYLQIALTEAKNALDLGNVPIGAVLVNSAGEIISTGANEIKTNFDVTAHAEVVAIRKAGKQAMLPYYEDPTWLFTTLEPCFACSFFVTRSNIKHVVWALSDPYSGGIDDLLSSDKLGEKIKALELIAEPIVDYRTESSQLMQKYYQNKGDVETARLFA